MIVTNPILPGFHPDPSAVWVDGFYYVATSTFEWFPGVEIHRSPDLTRWTLVSRPLDRPDLLDLRGVPDSGGVWAPCLSYADGLFYLVYSITRTVEETTQDTENYLTWARDVRGPWAPRVRLHSGGFDASLFHDTDGTHWVVGMRWDSRAERNPFAGIYLQEYSVPRQRLLGEPRLIFRGSPLGFTEGPHLYRVNGGYLLLVAEGGTREGHAALACRAPVREGPYAPDPRGPLLTSRHRPDWPIQYAGHGSLVEDRAGQWYLFHLGARKALFEGYSVFGRETFLQAVEVGADGYPRLRDGDVLPAQTVEIPPACLYPSGASPIGEPETDAFAEASSALGDEAVDSGPQAVSVSFDGSGLPLCLAWLREPGRHSLTERRGYLRLYGAESMVSRHRQCLLGTQLVTVPATVRTRLDYRPAHFQQAAGLTLFYHTANFYALLVTWDDALGRCLRLIRRDGRHTTLLAPMLPLPPDGEIGLRADLSADGIRFFCQADGSWEKIGAPQQQPLTILSDEYATQCGEQGYTGAFAGLCCQDQTGAERFADFAFFQLLPRTMPGRD